MPVHTLSYRTAAYTLAGLDRALDEIQELLDVQLNSSDDNPAVILVGTTTWERPYEEQYAVPGTPGAVLPTANFEPLPWVIAFERAAIALSHLSHASAQRTLKLEDPAFTGLSRFLGAGETGHAYGAIAKTSTALTMESRALANPVSMDFFPLAGDVEDMGTNAPRVLRNVRLIIDNLYRVLGIELMHAAQAIDLRHRRADGIRLATLTQDLFTQFRERVSFMGQDRTLSPDIEAAYRFLKGCKIDRADRVTWARRTVSCGA